MCVLFIVPFLVSFNIELSLAVGVLPQCWVYRNLHVPVLDVLFHVQDGAEGPASSQLLLRLHVSF